MRKYLKENILEIFQTMYEAHKKINYFFESANFENVSVILTDCQNTAIQIGEAIEQSEGEGFVSVKYLEEYCEIVYQIASGSSNFVGGMAQDILDKKLREAENSVINDIKVKREVVFLPYKASMWDSLESIWKAANEDPDCNVYVIPIPYYDKNPDKSFGEMHYEADLYPDYVTITHYDDYNFEEKRPDAIFVHNAYDDANHVTSVHPFFYSKNIKKYTDNLVYVPYFFTNKIYSESQLWAPAYYNADYIIVQNDETKEQFANYGYYSKVVALGSPKLDCVLNYSKEKRYPQILKAHKLNKKIIFLNTSISFFLNNSEFAIIKINEIIDEVKKNQNIFVVWRPHPLLDATINSMRPQLKQKFERLKEKFSELDNVIIDYTMNIDELVAASDAYIGEENSSIVVLFASLGKPVFVIDSESIYDSSYKECFFDFGLQDNMIYYVNSNFKSIIKADFATGEAIDAINMSDSIRSIVRPYQGLKQVGNCIYLSPMSAEDIIRYNIDDNSVSAMPVKESQSPNFNFINQVGSKLYFSPVCNNYLVSYDTDENKLAYYYEPVKPLIQSGSVGSFVSYASCVAHGIVFMASVTTNIIVAYNTLTNETSTYTVGKKNNGYWNMIFDGQNIWLNPVVGHTIIKWNYKTNEICGYSDYPAEFVIKSGAADRDYFLQFVDCDTYIAAIPKSGNMCIGIDKETGKMKQIFKNDYYSEGMRLNSNYNWKSNYYFAKRIEDKIYLLSAYDNSMLIYNIDGELLDRKYFSIPVGIKEKIEENIFVNTTADYINGHFYYENSILSVSKFINALVDDKVGYSREEQETFLKTMSNCDGTAGEKIYAFVKRD